MIELKSINKSFEDKQVLNNVNCLFENSKTNLIIGRSGSGKTVLISGASGLIGSYLVDLLLFKNRSDGLDCSVVGICRDRKRAPP